MQETEFMPGPWKIIGPIEKTEDWISSRFFIRAKTAPGGVAAIIGGLGEIEERANARLIATAPEMRYALSRCVVALQALYPSTGPIELEYRNEQKAVAGLLDDCRKVLRESLGGKES